MSKSVTTIIQEIADDICINFCKYHPEENTDCKYLEEHGSCPLWKLQ